MTKKITYTTPVGTLVWPKLNEVDVYQPMRNGKPNGEAKRRYITRIKFDDADHIAVDKFMKQAMKDLGLPKDSKLPWKTDKKNGDITLEAKSGEKFRPPVFDAKNNKVPASVQISGGSKAQINLTVAPYDSFGGGLTLYINAVRLLELQQRDANPFKDEAEGYTYDGEDDVAAEPASPFANDGEEDEAF